MNQLLIIAIVAVVTMIGVMIPNISAVSEKTFGDDYYVDEGFGFAIKIPNGGYVDTEGITVDDGRSLVQFDFGGGDNFMSYFNIHLFHEDPDLIYYDDLLYFFSDYPQTAGGEYTQQIRMTNEELEKQSDRYKITYEFTTKESYPTDFLLPDVAGKTFTLGNKLVIFLYPNGDYYTLMFSSQISSYSKDVKIFDSVDDTLYVGNVKRISSNTDNSYPTAPQGGGCLIATATYGSEMSQQVQQLRELRDNQLMNTESGSAFMSTFNYIYYSFSPTIADMEREHPMFKEAVKLAITPMISTLSLMESANSESEVLSIGISVIALNLVMYLGVPAIVIVGIRRKF
ncbi:hypothetical protein N8459_01380 [Nitrosopumilus sp.]|nr:hypothetical protein [Nitrosopumilus sp.]